MATTQTILVSGTYNGVHTGGPFSVPHGTSQIQINFNVTDAPAGANFTFEADTSSDGGVTWQRNPDGSGSSVGPFDDCVANMAYHNLGALSADHLGMDAGQGR